MVFMMGLVIILDNSENLTMTEDEEKIFVGDYPCDLSAGKQPIFFTSI